MNQCPKCYRDMTPIEECAFCGHRAALSPVRSDDLFDVLVAIVNTAQKCPDRCMVDVCNDNFVVWGVNLEASYVPDDEDEPIKIERTSNAAPHLRGGAPAEPRNGGGDCSILP